MTDERSLFHHGVLGMHWGIRRYQPYGEGGYNPKKKNRTERQTERLKRKAERLKRKEQRELRNEMISESIDIGSEYDKTKEGKAKRSAYEKEIRRMENSSDWTDSDDDRFWKIETDYLTSQAKYEGEKMVSKYGEAKVREILLRSSPKVGENAVEHYVREFKDAHRY